MSQQRIRAVFMRGGTSKALMFHRADLPSSERDWAPIFTAALGSPDPNGRQLDGMGGGVSSLSKVCVIGPPSRDDADLDYTFAQVSVASPDVDYAGNCGNMSSAVGPFAVDEQLIAAPHDGDATVRIHNTNTGKIIVSRFAVADGLAVVDGDLSIDGVGGTGAPIRLDFTDPGGAKTGRLLPTGNAVDTLDAGPAGRIEATLVDAANPGVFVRAADIGADGGALPAQMETDTALLARLEAIRQAAAVAMGIAPDLAQAARIGSVPKVAIVAPPAASVTLSGRTLAAADMDIRVRMISMGVPHRAVPLTGGLCLASACRIPGSIPQRMLPGTVQGDTLRIAHPSGVLLVGAAAEQAPTGLRIPYATVYRTARRLFEGSVLYRNGAARQPT